MTLRRVGRTVVLQPDEAAHRPAREHDEAQGAIGVEPGLPDLEVLLDDRDPLHHFLFNPRGFGGLRGFVSRGFFAAADQHEQDG